jgi:hypothetical protein
VLAQAIEDTGQSLPILVTELARIYLDQVDRLSGKIADPRSHARGDDAAIADCRAWGRSPPR